MHITGPFFHIIFELTILISILAGFFFLIWIKPCIYAIHQLTNNKVATNKDIDDIIQMVTISTSILIIIVYIKDWMSIRIWPMQKKTLMTLIEWYKEELIFYLLTIMKRYLIDSKVKFYQLFLWRFNIHINVDLDESILMYEHMTCMMSQQLHWLICIGCCESISIRYWR